MGDTTQNEILILRCSNGVLQQYIESVTQQKQNICITFIQRRPNVFDVGPTLYKCYTNICVCWDIQQRHDVVHIPDHERHRNALASRPTTE